jgi:hypothetical protein
VNYLDSTKGTSPKFVYALTSYAPQKRTSVNFTVQFGVHEGIVKLSTAMINSRGVVFHASTVLNLVKVILAAVQSFVIFQVPAKFAAETDPL